MTGDLNIWKLVINASAIVQFVLALLLFASVSSWAVILRKRSLIRRVRSEADNFESNFWSGGDLVALSKAIEAKAGIRGGMETIFESGFREFARLRQQAGLSSGQILEGAQRAMRVAHMKEIDRLEHNLAMLATTGSISPYGAVDRQPCHRTRAAALPTAAAAQAARVHRQRCSQAAPAQAAGGGSFRL